MKRLFLVLLGTATLVAGQSMAVPVTVTQPSPGYGGGHGGGEFNINPNITSGNYGPDVAIFGGFETFCVQANVDIAIPGHYNATLSSTDSSGNPLSAGTAWLYSLFATESSTLGYNYIPGVGRTSSADELQQAIWILQGQTGPNVVETATTSADVQLAIAHFGSLSAALAANNGQINVDIVQLFNSDGHPVQNMLALVPDGGSAILLLGAGLSSLAFFSRKIRVRA